MINGQVLEMRNSPHEINIRDNDETNDEKTAESAGTKVTKNRYYESGHQKTAEDDLEFLPITSETVPEGVDWTTGPRGAILSFAFMLTTVAILIFVMNFVHQRMPRNAPPLPDIGHELIPKLEPETLGDTVMSFMIISIFIAVITNRDRWPIVIRFVLTLAYLYLLRVVSISATSMPPTENHCRFQFVEIKSIFYNTLKGVLTLGNGNIHCGDLMFSGHTCLITNIWMTFQVNYKKNYIIRIFISILLLITITFIIGTRSHYTVDVWIAFWLTVFVHRSAPRRFPFTKRKIRHFFKNL